MRLFCTDAAPAPMSVLMSALLLASLSLGFLAVPGCAATQNGPSASIKTVPVAGDFDPTALREMGLSVRWLYGLELASRNGITDLEVLGDLIVAVEGPDNFITAIDTDAGTFEWKTLLGQDLESLFRPMRAAEDSLNGDRVFVNSAARLYTLDPATGRPIGVQSLDAPVTAGGELIGDYAVFGAAKGMAFAHDVDAGYAKWRYRMTGRLVSPPVRVSENTVFLGDEAGTYVMLDVSTGEPVFRNDVFGPIVAPAAVHRGDLLVPSADRTLYALDRATGNQSWTYRADSPLEKSPLSVGRDIYLPASGGGNIALDSRGNVRWENTLNATPVLASNRGILAIGKNTLLLIDPENGEVQQAVKMPGITQATPGPDGSLIIRTQGGRIARLDAID